MTEEEQKATRRLRPAQVGASTLGALTGAFLAARLGVYGTVIGVGVMSLVTTIGTELYIRSLERTKQAARLRARTNAGRRNAADVTAERADAASPDAPDGESRADERTPSSGAEPAADARARPPRQRLRWSLVASGSAVAFVLAMIVVTSIETVSGSTLSGAEGSTVSKIVTGDTGSDERAPDDRAPEPGDGPTAPADEPEQGRESTEPESPTGEGGFRDESGTETSEPVPEDDTVPSDEDTTPSTDEPPEQDETPDTQQ